MKKYLLLLIGLLSGVAAFAQTPVIKPVALYLGGGVSAGAYRGDLSSKYAKWTSAFHLSVQTNRKRWISSAFELSYGTLTGENLSFSHPEGTPNRFFSTNLFTANGSLHVNFIKTRDVIVYLSQGVGLTRFTPYDKLNNKLSPNGNTRATGELYSTTALVLPTNIGMMYLFYNGFALGLEGGFLNPQSDYLDNISQFGSDSGNDNVLRFKLVFFAPLSFEKPKEEVPKK